MRKPVVAGNWKMHKTLGESIALSEGILKGMGRLRKVDVILCPPLTALATVAKLLKRRKIGLGAQDCHWEAQGAYTGEVSAQMIKDTGAQYCIIGHSERRRLFGETDETVARKVKTVLANGLTPIICVGETLEELDANQTLAVVERQVRAALAPVSPEHSPPVILPHEPVWAIGTGRNATPAQAQEVHAFIRRMVGAIVNPVVAKQLRIQYGGSVKPDNSAELSAQRDVDGFLVGGASLDAASFVAIIKSTAGLNSPEESLCTS